MNIVRTGIWLTHISVELDAFPNLKYLTYGSPGKDFMIPYAVRQLDLFRSTCSLIEVSFDISLGHGNQLDQGMCGILDTLLTGDRFPSLQRVGLHGTITPELFPELKKTGRLFTLVSTFWTAGPVKKDIKYEAPTKEDENRIEVEEITGRIVETMGEDDTLESPLTNDTSYPQ